MSKFLPPRRQRALLALALLAWAPAQAAPMCRIPLQALEVNETAPENGQALALAREVSVSADGQRTELVGDVLVLDSTRTLKADRVLIDRSNDAISLTGQTDLQTGNLRFRSQRDIFISADDTRILDAEFGQIDNGTLNGTASELSFRDNRLVLNATDVSSCSRENRQWRLIAEQIVLERNSGRGQAHNVRLYLGQVPVFYSPWLVFNISGQRQSGLLAPSLYIDSDSGLSIDQPWYWNIAPNRDATFTTSLSSERSELTTEWRWLNRYGLWVLDLAALSEDSRWQGRLRGQARQPNGPLQAEVDWVINDDDVRYSEERLYNDDPLENADALPRRVGLSYQQGQHQGQLQWQEDLISDPDSDAATAFHTLPGARWQSRWQNGGNDISLQAGAEQLARDGHADGQRQWLDIDVQRDVSLGDVHLSPGVQLQYTRQRWDDHSGEGEVARATARLHARRDWQWQQGRHQYQVSPQAAVSFSSEGGDVLRDVDTDFSTPQDLDSFMRRGVNLSGHDYLPDADMARAGISWQRQRADGTPRFGAHVGVQHAFEEEDTRLLNGNAPGSELVIAGAQAELTRDFSLNGRWLWQNDTSTELREQHINLDWQGQRYDASLAHTRQHDDSEDISLAVGGRFSDHWRWDSRARRERNGAGREDDSLRLSIGYQSCCMQVQAFVQQEQKDGSDADLSGGVRLELLGFGGSGSQLASTHDN